jgi:hypothetical protein
VIGGSNSSGLGDPCGDPSTPAVQFSPSKNVRDHLDQLQPHGGGSLFTAYIVGKNQLEELPPNTIRTLIFITGSSDACEDDEWQDLERIFNFPSPVEVYSEIIIIDEDTGIDMQSIAERLGSLSESVNVQAPQSISDLEQSSTTVINNVDVYVSQAIINIATDNPISPLPPASTPSKTPTVGMTNTPSKTPVPLVTFPPPPGPTATKTSPPIPTATPSPTVMITPTFTPLPPHVWNILPYQTDVFSPGCPLISNARVYAQFSQAQAGISAALVPNGRTNQGLRLDFTTVSEAGGSYAGWEVWLGADDQSGIDLSSYSSLVFYIRGIAGGEEPNVYLMMPAKGENFQRFYKDVELVTPLTTSWQQVVIPLSHFASSQEPNQQVDLRNIQRVQVLFEWYPQPTTGRIYIDDLCVQ